MIHKLRLDPVIPERMPSGTLTWDDEKGEVTGYFADKILEAVDSLEKNQVITYTPLGLRSENDPLKDPEAMSILLLLLGMIPPENLTDLYDPPPEPPDIPGALF